MTLTLDRVTHRRVDELPPVLEVDEVTALLEGRLAPPRRRTHTASPRVTPPPTSAGRRQFGEQNPHLPSALPDPRLWVQRLAPQLVECLAGHRPPAQLARHVDGAVQARLSRRYRTAVRRGPMPGLNVVRRVRVMTPAPGVVEAAVIARVNGRPTPMALRLEAHHGRWVVTVMELI